MLFLEGGNYGGIILILITIMLGPPILLTTIGLIRYKKKPGPSKVLFILAVLYLIIGGGLCGSMLVG